MAQLSMIDEGRVSFVSRRQWSEAAALALQLDAADGGEGEIDACVKALANAITAIKAATEAKRRWVKNQGAGCAEAEKMQTLIMNEIGRADRTSRRIMELVAAAESKARAPKVQGLYRYG
ncbi:hypothetical protein [Azospirillum rugosum]|uniref:Uncharacterized protein n=1 Tax=Azospirillum rugosum TaxID=416170 RepID=A0ABS4SK41_9PROT|nr:hypothetical protein [Azospirillum rugosum]MBP2292921.1 hypothetical protein [Azospirillum rugosum]MDQ0529327.1 hypothetical protein [Azospirillum rugosum]